MGWLTTCLIFGLCLNHPVVCFQSRAVLSSWLRLYTDIWWCFMLNAQHGYNNNANMLIMDVLKAGYPKMAPVKSNEIACPAYMLQTFLARQPIKYLLVFLSSKNFFQISNLNELKTH